MEMMYFKENVRFLRKLKGKSQNEFADDLGYKSFTTVQKWEDGTSYPSLPVVSQIADYFQVSLEMLVYANLSSIKSHLHQVPVLGTVRTGPGILAVENIQGWEYVPDSEKGSGEYFYLSVVGDSMINARIMEGDLLYCRKQSTIEHNEIAVVLMDGEEATCKRVLFKDGRIVLQPENPDYEPMVFTQEEINQGKVKIIGKVLHNKIKF
ncbi:MAG: helix-turn-helix domain-containing protein [Erysipelotrichaceae bacterium]|nr:helix-turn-helix domain-containing protein [Erysipelotrichaceae bacterium]